MSLRSMLLEIKSVRERPTKHSAAGYVHHRYGDLQSDLLDWKDFDGLLSIKVDRLAQTPSMSFLIP